MNDDAIQLRKTVTEKCEHCGAPADFEVRTLPISLKGKRLFKKNGGSRALKYCIGCLTMFGTVVGETIKP